jgi:hypothetical protein
MIDRDLARFSIHHTRPERTGMTGNNGPLRLHSASMENYESAAVFIQLESC